jgi:hypothetical protein
MAEACTQISQSNIIGFWKVLCCHFIQDFQCSELGEEMKELKEQFSVLLNRAALMDRRRWTQCSSDCKRWTQCSSDCKRWTQCSSDCKRWTQCSSDRKRKLSNEELMQTHEEFGLVTGDTETDCCNKEELVSDLIQTFHVKPLQY